MSLIAPIKPCIKYSMDMRQARTVVSSHNEPLTDDFNRSLELRSEPVGWCLSRVLAWLKILWLEFLCLNRSWLDQAPLSIALKKSKTQILRSLCQRWAENALGRDQRALSTNPTSPSECWPWAKLMSFNAITLNPKGLPHNPLIKPEQRLRLAWELPMTWQPAPLKMGSITIFTAKNKFDQCDEERQELIIPN